MAAWKPFKYFNKFTPKPNYMTLRIYRNYGSYIYYVSGCLNWNLTLRLDLCVYYTVTIVVLTGYCDVYRYNYLLNLWINSEALRLIYNNRNIGLPLLTQKTITWSFSITNNVPSLDFHIYNWIYSMINPDPTSDLAIVQNWVLFSTYQHRSLQGNKIIKIFLL